MDISIKAAAPPNLDSTFSYSKLRRRYKIARQQIFTILRKEREARRKLTDAVINTV